MAKCRGDSIRLIKREVFRQLEQGLDLSGHLFLASPPEPDHRLLDPQGGIFQNGNASHGGLADGRTPGGTQFLGCAEILHINRLFDGHRVRLVELNKPFHRLSNGSQTFRQFRLFWGRNRFTVFIAAVFAIDSLRFW